MTDRARSLILSALLFIVIGGSLSATPHDKPGPAADRLYFRAFDVDRAPRDLEAGNMDMYMYSLKITAAQRLKGDGRFNLYEAPASTVSLLLNPAPAPEGQFNPFSIKEVRQAMQYLVDRDFISRDIYNGMAVPMISHVSPRDFDYLNVYGIERASGIDYDPEYGRDLIRDAMIDAGAKLEGGLWTYDGQPIRVRIIGRVEDERRNIADLVRSELERAGFMTAISYRPFAAAIISVYASDPQTFEWHIYTEGWGRSSPQRWDYGNVNSMNSPWSGNMPGWQELGFWQYKQQELDRLGKRLFRGEFQSIDERNDIYGQMTEIGLDESVRIWLATAVNSFPTSNRVEGVSRDPVGGLRSPWTLRESYIPGQSDLTVGHLWVWTERTTWNPIGGLGDVYSVDMWRAIHDSPMANHPFTGIPQAVRVDFDVRTAGPGRSFDVPSDAVLWDADADRWRPVGSNATAVSRVIFDYSLYFDSKWHNGTRIDMADVIYSIAQGYELAYDKDKTRIETALGITSRPYYETFKGYRVLDDNRLEVYVDYWHFEENHIASYSSPTALSMPWELLAAMDDLVFNQRRAAYSDTAASRFNVAWLSLVMDRDARMVEKTLRTFIKDRYVPKGYFSIGGKDLVSSNNATGRYEASKQWFADRGHLVISNGPFSMVRYDPPAQFAELEAFRDPTYPFKPGDWDFGDIPEIEIAGIEAVEIQAGRDTRVVVQANGPGKIGIAWLLFDPAAREVVAEGEAEQNGSAFAVEIPKSVTNTLFPGLYELSLIAYSDEIAIISEKTVDVDVE